MKIFAPLLTYLMRAQFLRRISIIQLKSTLCFEIWSLPLWYLRCKIVLVDITIPFYNTYNFYHIANLIRYVEHKSMLNSRK